MDLKEAIEILNKLMKEANIEDMDMNDCFCGEHIDAIETVLEELEKYKIHNEKYMNGELFSAKQMKFVKKEYIPKKKIEHALEVCKNVFERELKTYQTEYGLDVTYLN